MTLSSFDLPVGRMTLRKARADDVGAIVGLIADDQLRASDDSTEDLTRYLAAFAAVDADGAQLLLVAESPDGGIAATTQLTFIPGLARGGATRMQIEAVRVRSDLRGNGLGAAMMMWAIGEARRRGAGLVQLTSDESRSAAHRFYERLGFSPTHIGFKLVL
ncbi:MAG: GNAT family N-acetyltransferase [Actinomycetales bacterium]|jgi:GNAT superfamily N-acetyltransferase